MITIALWLLSFTALGGLVMALIKLGKKRIPLTLAVGHGLLAATGLIYLFIGVSQVEAGAGMTAIVVLFILAALVGLLLFLGMHLRNRALPFGLISLHAALAVISLVLLSMNQLRS